MGMCLYVIWASYGGSSAKAVFSLSDNALLPAVAWDDTGKEQCWEEGGGGGLLARSDPVDLEQGLNKPSLPCLSQRFFRSILGCS